MVLIEVIDDEPAAPAPSNGGADAAKSRSEERLRDADEIEKAAESVTRDSARLHLQQLVTKLRKEGQALKRVAASAAAAASPAPSDKGEDAPATKPAPLPPVADPPKRAPASVQPPRTAKYQSFPTYQVDMGSYNSPTISVYVPLNGIGKHDKSKITCELKSTSFDLVVADFEGRSYRLLNDNLEKDIDPSKSKYVVKPNKIIIKLGKVKGEYGYDSWTQLTAKKKKTSEEKKDPTAGIMDLMKDMYDSGDDNMKKMIGETMYKQRTGQLNKDDPMGGMGM